MWDLIVSVPDHCLSFYLTNRKLNINFVATLKFERISSDKAASFPRCKFRCSLSK